MVFASTIIMKTRLVYVELKSGYADDGSAWISVAAFSKSGATIYSNGQAFKSLKGSGVGANCYDLETGDEYWISGIKKDGQDRHKNDTGVVRIDQEAIPDYLAETALSKLPGNLVEAKLNPSARTAKHHKIEHLKLGESTRRRDFVRTPSRNSIVKSKH
ncbi:MAG: hypothetical protein AAGF33_18420 [Pseudomonadota bacterium]